MGINTWLVTGNGKLRSFPCYWSRVAGVSSASCILAGGLGNYLPPLSPHGMILPPGQPASTAAALGGRQIGRAGEVLWKVMDREEGQVRATGLETEALRSGTTPPLPWAVRCGTTAATLHLAEEANAADNAGQEAVAACRYNELARSSPRTFILPSLFCS